MAKKASKEEKLSESAIELKPLQIETIIVPIIGITPVIPHKWSEKAKRLMLDAQQGNKTKQRDPKVPETDAEAATYRLPDGRPGLPAVSFKGAIVAGCRFFTGITLTQMKMCIFVEGEGADQLIPIEGEALLREDTVRNASGVADLRYRYQFWPWSVMLPVRYHSSIISRKSLFALIDAGGNAGVGDWRPSSPRSTTGTYGRFQIDTTQKVTIL
jgi:hypothetical protein